MLTFVSSNRKNAAIALSVLKKFPFLYSPTIFLQRYSLFFIFSLQFYISLHLIFFYEVWSQIIELIRSTFYNLWTASKQLCLKDIPFFYIFLALLKVCC